MPSAARMAAEGVKDGWRMLARAGPGHYETHQRLTTAGVHHMKAHTDAESLVNECQPRKADKGWIQHTKSSGTKVGLKQSSDSPAESKLNIICLRTLADVDSSTVTSVWRSRSKGVMAS